MNLKTKIHNIKVLLQCGRQFLIGGKADRAPKDLKNILILQATPNLGDLVCITPLFRAVKRKYPQSKLYVIGRQRGADILYHNPYIDEYWGYDRNPFELMAKVKQVGIDFACTTNPGTNGLAFLYLADIPFISCFTSQIKSKSYAGSYALLKKLVRQVDFAAGSYIPRQYLKLLEPIGIATEDVQFDLFFSPEAEKTVSNLFKMHQLNPEQDLIVAMAPGGSIDIRWWGRDKYAQLADYLYQRYRANIFLVGAGGDQKPIEEMIHYLSPQTKFVNLLNQPLDEFKAFLAKTSVVISNDSGPMTLAKAFKVPTAVFIGPTDEREYQLPVGPFNRIIKSASRGVPVTTALNWTDYDEREAKRQINAITLEEAKKEVDILMTNLHRKPVGLDESTGKL